MEIKNSKDYSATSPVTMLVYGDPGVGKTTLATTAPKPLIVDCEGGSKYLGRRGLDVDVASLKQWSDVREVLEVVASKKYETIVIDTIGELMEKLRRYMIAKNDKKLVQNDGTPTAAGWGWMKTNFKLFIKTLNDSGINVLLIGHASEEKDDDRIVLRPKIETKVHEDVIGIVEVVGYMTMIKQDDGNVKRLIVVDEGNDRYRTKDRTGQLGKVVEPNLTKVFRACQGIEIYPWCSPTAKLYTEEKKETPVVNKKSTPAKEEVAEDDPSEGMIKCSNKRCKNLLDSGETEYSEKMYGHILCSNCQEKLDEKEDGKA